MPQNTIKDKILYKNLGPQSSHVSDLFAKIHFGEKMGTGFERIREVCRKENAPFPEIEFNENYFYVTFRQSHEYLKLAAEERERVTEKVEEKAIEKAIEKVEEKATEKVTENQKRILEEIIKNKYITVKRLSEIIGISERKTQENIKKLKGKRLLKRVGPDKGGYWEILAK
jgi:ATP-dependent DNA helicase RecG